MVIFPGYAESPPERGRTAPSVGKHVRTMRPEAFGIDWELANHLVLSDALVASDEKPKQAPPMELSAA